MADADLRLSDAATLAVVVTPGVSVYLHRTLRGVAEQLTPPGTVLVVDTLNARVQEGEEGITVHATMSMAADVANAYWQGRENLPLAMAKGKIKVSGEIATLLRLAPLTKRLYPVYTERLRRDGRVDLLVA